VTLDKKTDRKFWKDFWANTKLPQTINKRLIIYKRLDKLFKKYLKPDKNAEILEIGCAPAAWLIYFNKEFGYKISGIEYLKSGCDISKKNLKLTNTDGKIICADLFNNKLKKDSYDYVYSCGFIEHFDPPDTAIKKHLELLKKNGNIVVLIPNFKGFNLLLLKILNKKITENHNLKIMDLHKFTNAFKKQGIKIISAGYIGKLNLTVIHWGWLQNTPLIYFVHTVNQIISRLWFFESKIFSPYIYLIGKK